MTQQRRINVIFGDNGSGLTRDASVLRDALRSEGYRVGLTPRAPRRFPLTLNHAPELALDGFRRSIDWPRRAWARHVRKWDINLHLEHIQVRYLDTARVNCFIPNQEWLDDDDRARLHEIDLVLFKTKEAQRLLGPHTASGALVGFSSLDRRDVAARPKGNTSLHVAGWNPRKGTRAVLSVWSTKPSWPSITIVSELVSQASTGNVHCVTSRITDRALRQLQNKARVHVCPSEVEGFGHTLAEALSCGAIVVTTAAPPMNELVTLEEGFLVPFARAVPMGAGMRYLVDQEHLSDVLDFVWRLDGAAVARRAAAARARFETIRTEFRRRLAQALSAI
jgi:glycosyltransferase involved in cell wall biosynthesis